MGTPTFTTKHGTVQPLIRHENHQIPRGWTVTQTKRSVNARAANKRVDLFDRRLTFSSTTQMMNRLMTNIIGVAMQWITRKVVQVGLAELGQFAVLMLAKMRNGKQRDVTELELVLFIMIVNVEYKLMHDIVWDIFWEWLRFLDKQLLRSSRLVYMHVHGVYFKIIPLNIAIATMCARGLAFKRSWLERFRINRLYWENSCKNLQTRAPWDLTCAFWSRFRALAWSEALSSWCFSPFLSSAVYVCSDRRSNAVKFGYVLYNKQD